MTRHFSLFLLTLALLGGTNAFASEGDSLWSRTYGGSSWDDASSIIPSGDGGFLLAGGTQSFGAGGWDMWLVKVNSQGDSLWSYTYGGSAPDWASSIIPSSDGGFLLAGCTFSFGAGSWDMWLVKVNAQGDSLWSRTYGGSSWDEAFSIIPSGDGGYLLAGLTISFGVGDRDMWLVKVNAQGDSLWSQTYGGGSDDWAYSIIPSGDGGFLLAGRTESFGAGYNDMWLVKVNAQGDSLWSRTYGGSRSWDEAFSIIPSGDGGFLLAGRTDPLGAINENMLLVKVDANGDSLWSQTYGGNISEYANAIIASGDGGFLLAGISAWNMWLLKVDAQGDSLWSRTYGGSYFDEANSIIPSGDGGFLLAGWTQSFGAGNNDMWLVKVDGIPGLNVSMDPVSPPIQIPAGGGSFNFNVSVGNNDPETEAFDAWIMVRLPNQSWYGPVLGPLPLTLPPSTTISRLRTQNVPGSAPAGNYLYEARVGDYPDMIWNSDNFAFTKLGSRVLGQGSGVWTNTGEEFDVGARHAVPVSGSETTPTTVISPNPFNPSTVASYELRDASHVSLKVYDTAGRLVETLVDSWREAGEHRATFDGSGLPSGVYLYRLQAGEVSASGKMVLLK